MSYLRISTVSANVPLYDLGYTIAHPTNNYVISDQFSVDDLEKSADLDAAIQGGTLTAEVNLDGTWTAVAAGNWDSKDVFSSFGNIYEICNTVDNERLVDGSDASAATKLHHHDTDYYTKSELGDTTNPDSGASLIGVDPTNITNSSSTNVQAVLEDLDSAFASSVNLDTVYDNDSDGIMNVDGSSKDLNLRSDNANDILISRWDTTNSQNALQLDVSADELLLGAIAVGALGRLNVRIPTDLTVDGDITFTGEITDTTVNEMNVTNANIILREGAATGADASLQVERGSTGNDAQVRWNETTDRWMAGLEGGDNTIALLELDEVVSGVWEMQGGGATEPSMYLTEKAAAPTTNLGTATQIPISMMTNGILAIYDKSNSRDKFLSVQRQYMVFSGRNNKNNTNEYARINNIPAMVGGNRLIRNATLVGISIQTPGAETWTAEVRRNGAATILDSLAAVAATGAQDGTKDTDFNAGDVVQVFITGTQIERPIIVLEFAYRF